MLRKFAIVFAFGFLGDVLSTNSAFGQIVSVSPGGGVHVRAPFVRVDVYPRGGVSVPAPFAAVDVPGRRYYYEPGPMVMDGPMPGRPTMPTAQELAGMDDDTLLRLMRSVAGQLRYELGRFDTGDRWQRYLRLPEEMFAGASVNPNERRQALETTFDRFNKIAADPQYGMIASLPDFGAAQSAMAELISRLDRSTSASGTRIEELPPPDPAHGKQERSLLPGRTN